LNSCFLEFLHRGKLDKVAKLAALVPSITLKPHPQNPPFNPPTNPNNAPSIPRRGRILLNVQLPRHPPRLPLQDGQQKTPEPRIPKERRQQQQRRQHRWLLPSQDLARLSRLHRRGYLLRPQVLAQGVHVRGSGTVGASSPWTPWTPQSQKGYSS